MRPIARSRRCSRAGSPTRSHARHGFHPQKYQLTVMSEMSDANRTARDAVLARVRKALAKNGADPQAKAGADAYIAAHRQGPRPTMPADLRTHFITRATDMSSTVESIAALAEVPRAVARYLDTLGAEA